MKFFFAALWLVFGVTMALAANPTPLTMQIDRSANSGAGPFPICANVLSSAAGCQSIGTMGPGGFAVGGSGAALTGITPSQVGAVAKDGSIPMTGPLTLLQAITGLVPSVNTVYSAGAVVPVTPTAPSLRMSQAPGNTFGYGTPYLYVERALDDTPSLTQTSTWGNPLQSPVVSIVNNIGPNNKTNPMALSLQTESNTPSPFGTGPNYSPISAWASLSQSYLDSSHGGQHRDIVGGNIVVAQGGTGGTSSGNMTGLEIDMLNQFVPTSGELSNNVGLLMQSGGGNVAGQPIYAGTAISITGEKGGSSGVTGNGWHDGIVAYGAFDRWAYYAWNAINAPNANGLHVGITYGAAAGVIAELGTGEYNAGNFIPIFKVTGDGGVQLGQVGGGGSPITENNPVSQSVSTSGFATTIKNNANVPGANGLSVYSTYGATAATVADFGSGSTSIFKITGEGSVSIGAPGAGPVTTNTKLVAAAGFNQGLTTPASATAPCTAGDRAADATYIYTCVATNSWHRVSNGAAW